MIYPLVKKLFTPSSIRALSAMLCISLINSCAYETYPISTSSSFPYKSPNQISDPTIPLVVGATAIGALAYYGKKKNDRRYRNGYYYNSPNYYRDRRYHSYSNQNHYPNSRYHNHHYQRSNHTYCHKEAARRKHIKQAREALIKKRHSERKHQITLSKPIHLTKT